MDRIQEEGKKGDGSGEKGACYFISSSSLTLFPFPFSSHGFVLSILVNFFLCRSYVV